MSPEQEDAARTVLIANLMLTIKRGDPRRTAVGLLAMAQVLVEDDMLGQIALAEIMGEAKSELESRVGQLPQPSEVVIPFARRQ